jgi:pimeloyl-ACP methyl ester carboxylesterase
VPTLILTGAPTPGPAPPAEFLAGNDAAGLSGNHREAGHLPQLEQPEAVTKVLETFLRAGRH